MPDKFVHICMVCLLSLLGSASAKAGEKIVLDYSDELKVKSENNKWIWYVTGNVDFRTETGHIYCDSAVFLPGKSVNLKGNVLLDDASYQLKADSVRYDINTGRAVAFGKHVELWSYRDSLFATGVYAIYHRYTKQFEMDQRPVVYFKYPDTAHMVEVVADYVRYDSTARRAEASGKVVITSQDMVATAECAVMDTEGDLLDLYDHPVVKREKSELTGDFIMIRFDKNKLSKIDVIDSAFGSFVEPIDSIKSDYDRSILSGRHIILYFENGYLDQVLCYGQAYSWYYPSLRGGIDYNENSVSGDTIRFHIQNERLQSVTVVGGAIGTYITGKVSKLPELPDSATMNDSAEVVGIITSDTNNVTTGNIPGQSDTLRISDTTVVEVIDTAGITDSLNIPKSIYAVERPLLISPDSINYSSEYIEYDLTDSMITLRKDCKVKSKDMSLKSYKVTLDTEKRLVEAFAAEVKKEDDTLPDIQKQLAAELQPVTIPVVLKDGDKELYGDYLEYSLDTKKGRIVQSKTSFEQGFYYGDKLLREQKDVLYIDDAYYTTCDAAVPHYHFRSSRMKLIEGNKAIARPVVFFVGQVPLMAIPYYVFPLKKGRHSGFLTFDLGNIERGDRYVRNVGYYWAASEYWDWLSAFDYFEKKRALIFRNRINFNKRYVLNGYINVEHSRYASYDYSVGDEKSRREWVINGSYKHQITPSFRIDGYGSFQTSSSYFSDFSNNIDDVLNRQVISKLNFSKQFGRSSSLTGRLEHTVDLDKESRTDLLPSVTLSLPVLYPFGNGHKDADDKLIQKWYNSITFRYSPSLINYSSRITKDSVFVSSVDTVINIDSSGVADTTITEIKDTVSYRSRKEYARIDHRPKITLPVIRPIKYINIIPAFSYNESWYKIFETDQSLAAGVDASTTYRTYTYSGSVSANTVLYGTVYPKIGGLLGLRHVMTPSVAYTWKPEIDQHPKVRSYAGGTGYSKKTSSLTFSLKNQFQAKIKKGEKERNLELLSMNSSFSYNFEATDKPLSQLRTSFSTSTIPKITINGSMLHTFYDPKTDKQQFLSPTLLSWSMTVNLRLAGKTFFFDDIATGIPRGADSANQVNTPQSQTSGGKRGWNLSINYNISESNRYTNYSKKSQVTFNLGFNLTPVTAVSYSHTYNIANRQTVYQKVSINRVLHCWQGSLWWVPTGPTKGFGFKLNVIALPDIKLDNNYSSFQTSLLNR